MKKIYKSLILVSFIILNLNNLKAACLIPTQASKLGVSSVVYNGATFNWTEYGAYSIVIIGPYSAGNISGPSIPTGTNGPPYYAPNANYTSAPTYSGSFRIVYEGTGNSVAVSGLSAGTRYSVYVFSYNYDYIFPNYTYCENTSITANQNRRDFYTLSSEPVGRYTVTNVSSYTTSSVSLSINTSNGVVGARRVVIIQPSGGTYNPPVDGQLYGSSTTNVSYAYGSGPYLGGNSYVVYNGTATSYTVTGLAANTAYYFIVYEYNVNSSAVDQTENYYTGSYLWVLQYTNNNVPTVTSISDQTSNCINVPNYTVNLSGIGTGGEAGQTLSVSATSSNTAVVSHPTVTYTSPNSTGSIKYNVIGSGTSTISVTVNDGGYYNPSVTKTFNVTVTPLPSAISTLSGSSTICAGSASTYTASVSSAATAYSWTTTTTGVSFNSSSTATTTNTVNFSPSNFTPASSNAVFTVTPVNMCGTGTAKSYTTTVNGKPSVSKAGIDDTTCSSVASLHANGPKVGTGIWSTAAGSASCSFNNVNDSLTNVSGMVAGPPAILVWTISNGVCTPARDTVKIVPTVCSIQADFTVNNTQPCVTTATTFTDGSVASGGITTYSWDFDYNGTGSASPATATTAGPHNVTYSTSGTKTVRLSISGPGGSSVETKTAFINVQSTPGALSAVSGDNSVCQTEEQVLYSVSPAAGVTSYSWTLPSGALINTGGGTEQISVDFSNSAQSGNVSVKGVNACGQGPASTYSVTVNQLPDAPSAITGNDVICSNANNEIYSIDPISNATSYVWWTKSGNIDFDAPANTYTVSADVIGSVDGGDVIIVMGQNACGNGTTCALSVTFDPKPEAATSIIGENDITACEGIASVQFTVDPINNALTYSWFTPNGTTITGGQGTNTITVQFDPAVASSGVIAVAGHNNCGYGLPDTLHFNFHPTPAVNLCYSTVDETSSYVQLAWEKPSISAAIDSFRVYRKFGNNYFQIGSVDYNSPGLFIDSLSTPNNTFHFYAVTAVDSCGNESVKDTANAHKTIFLQASLGTGNGINLLWNGYAGTTADWYRILRDTLSNGDFTIIDSVSNGTHLFTDPNGQLFPDAQYRIEAVLAGSCTPSLKFGQHSFLASFSTSKSNIKNNPTSVGINKLAESGQKIIVYPNPNTGLFTIKLPVSNEKYNVSIYNQLGQVVHSELVGGRTNLHTVNLSNIAPGVYSIQVITDGFRSFEKIIIQ